MSTGEDDTKGCKGKDNILFAMALICYRIIL